MDYLHGEFLQNYHEVEELNKMFHYVWLLLSIVLVAWELLEDGQFPSIALDLPEAMKNALLWETKEAQRIKDIKIYWILMEMNIHMAINHKLQLSSTVYTNLQGYAKFKSNFHHVSIRVQKDPPWKWYDFPYLEMDDAIDAVLDQ